MVTVLRNLLMRYFSDEEAIMFFLIFMAALAVMYWLGGVLAPLFSAMIIAYLLMPLVDSLTKRRVPHIMAVSVVFLLFVSVLLLVFFVFLPLLIREATGLVSELPNMIEDFKLQAYGLADSYPKYIKPEMVDQWFSVFKADALKGSAPGSDNIKNLLNISITGLSRLMAILIYLVVVPILVFFILKDRIVLWQSLSKMLPNRRNILKNVSVEMNLQISNYVRGKAIEILIVGGVSYVVFSLLGLNYAITLALLVGFSVLIPYIGAAIVTLPVLIVALMQWGVGSEFYSVLVAYAVIQLLDGNVLVPLLFSEAVNLHPISIIVAVLLFGGIWGFWGVFFAIPLATLVKAIYNAWPHGNSEGIESQDSN